jgi:hypothetical protein
MILNVENNTKFRSVIINDAKRTRVRESILIPNFKDILEKMLTFFCKTKEIQYKQGLNEIFGPLILIQHKIKQIKLPKIYLFGEVFIDKFLPNYYYETDFCALKGSLRLFFILLKYHEPSVYNVLDKNEILPEMYATNWIMTLMSGKLRIDVLFELWNYLLEYDDQLLIHFILVAFIKLKRELIINCDKTFLPSLMANLTILEKDEGQFWITVNIEIAFISQSLYHFAFMTYVQFSLTVMLYLSDTFFFCSSHQLTFHHIVSISQEYSGVKVYSVFQFLNNVVHGFFFFV